MPQKKKENTFHVHLTHYVDYSTFQPNSSTHLQLSRLEAAPPKNK